MKYELKRGKLNMIPESIGDGFVLGKVMDRVGGEMTQELSKEPAEMEVSVKIDSIISKLVWG